MTAMLAAVLRGATSGGGDPYFSSVVSLLNFIGANGSTTFIDAKGHIWTRGGNAAISTADNYNGQSSLYCDGASWISTPDSTDFTVGRGDFTYELFARSAGNGQYDQLCGQRDAAGTANATFPLTRNLATSKLFASYSNGSSFANAIGAADVFNNAWHHIACCRFGDSLLQWIDGQLDAQLSLPTNFNYLDSADVFSIGRAGSYNGQYFKGYIGGFRFTKGVARYTSTFGPIQGPFPAS